MSKILVIPDVQIKPGIDLSFVYEIGQYLVDKRPDIVVCLGDFFDFPSLSSYDRGKLSFEGRRLQEDIASGKAAMELMLRPLRQLQERQQLNKKKIYRPRLVFTLGNHEERLNRLSNEMPELAGFVGYDLLELEKSGWEVYDFLKPVEIGGIYFCHYMQNHFTGKPLAGSALNQLKTVGRSFVVGHKQILDVAMLPTIDGDMRIGIVAGAAYPHMESYKGHQGNHHWRGIFLLHNCKNGYGDPCFVSLDYLKNRYRK